MNKYTKRIIQKIQKKRHEVEASVSNEWDKGYVWGLQAAIKLIEHDYIHNNQDESLGKHTSKSSRLFKFADPNDVLNNKI